MRSKVLLVRVEGPLQSWGLRARWDVRDSSQEPTKSGVVGLIAAALGYSRDDPRIVGELEEGLEMGVRVEQEGSPLEDYHTVTGFLPMAEGGFKYGGGGKKSLEKLERDPLATATTIVSIRRYLMDASFLIALGGRSAESPEILGRCASALKNPVWPLFLGRRACVPSRPVFEALTDQYAGIEDALRRHPWSVLGAGAAPRFQNANAQLRMVVEHPEGAGRDDRRRASEGRLYGRRFVREEWIACPESGSTTQ